MATAAKPDHAAGKILLALLALGVGHVALYLFLTGDARKGLDTLSETYTVAQLEDAKVPDAPPAPGTAAYSPWLRSFERHVAAKDYDLHSRHEALMRYGMVISFLIAVCILGATLLRLARTRTRPLRAGTRSRAPVAVAPVLVHPARRRYRRSA